MILEEGEYDFLSVRYDSSFLERFLAYGDVYSPSDEFLKCRNTLFHHSDRFIDYFVVEPSSVVRANVKVQERVFIILAEVFILFSHGGCKL